MKRRSRPGIIICAALAASAILPAGARGQGPPDIVWEVQGHSGTVNGVAFSPDGSVLATGADRPDSAAKLWRVSDGKLLDTFTGHRDGIQSVDLSPNRRFLAAGYVISGYPPGNKANVWDLASGTVRHTFGGGLVAFGPDGEYLACGGLGVIRYVFIYRLSDGQRIVDIYTGTYNLDVAYSPDGRLVASSGTDNLVHLWDPQTGKEVRTLSGHTDDVNAIAFSPDGEMLASGAGGFDEPGESTVKLWRVADGVLLRTLSGHGTWVNDVAFSPDGRYLITSGRTDSASTIRFWRVADGKQVHYYDQGLSYGVPCARFSPDGSLFAYGRGRGYVAVAKSPVTMLGDMNCDGKVDFDDIDPFVLALGGEAGYLAVYPNCDWLNADCNGDGTVDFDDIDPFVALLAGT